MRSTGNGQPVPVPDGDQGGDHEALGQHNLQQAAG
jgi:hypothetical protein